MKVIAAAFASLLLLPVLVIGAVAGGVSMPDPSATPTLAAGALDDLAAEVLAHPRIGLTAAARGDVEKGTVDPRILAILLFAAEDHTLDRVGPIVTGHSYYVKGTTRVSNHVFGRAVDILAVDGAPVDSSNLGAYRLVEELLGLPSELAPDEIGAPWVISNGTRSSFHDSAHGDHVHAGHDA